MISGQRVRSKNNDHRQSTAWMKETLSVAFPLSKRQGTRPVYGGGATRRTGPAHIIAPSGLRKTAGTFGLRSRTRQSFVRQARPNRARTLPRAAFKRRSRLKGSRRLGLTKIFLLFFIYGIGVFAPHFPRSCGKYHMRRPKNRIRLTWVSHADIILLLRLIIGGIICLNS